MFKSQAYLHFRIAAAFSLALIMLVAAFISIYGKNESFLIINKFNNSSFDYFFQYFTYLGDGLVWIPLLAYVFLFKKDFLLVIILAFILSTLFTQFCKWVIFADSMRPVSILQTQVRTITGMVVHKTSSFPSGHTTTAFTFALLLAFLNKKYFWTFFFPIVAFFVGYSRVYLAQHFVTDVLAGMIVGMVSVFLSLILYESIKGREPRI